MTSGSVFICVWIASNIINMLHISPLDTFILIGGSSPSHPTIKLWCHPTYNCNPVKPDWINVITSLYVMRTNKFLLLLAEETKLVHNSTERSSSSSRSTGAQVLVWSTLIWFDLSQLLHTCQYTHMVSYVHVCSSEFITSLALSPSPLWSWFSKSVIYIGYSQHIIGYLCL